MLQQGPGASRLDYDWKVPNSLTKLSKNTLILLTTLLIKRAAPRGLLTKLCCQPKLPPPHYRVSNHDSCTAIVYIELPLRSTVLARSHPADLLSRPSGCEGAQIRHHYKVKKIFEKNLGKVSLSSNFYRRRDSFPFSALPPSPSPSPFCLG